MPKRINRKSDLGYTLPISDVVDQDNVFFTEEGWVYRHFKSDPNDPDPANHKYWDEILVAGQVMDEDGGLDLAGENAPIKLTVNDTPRTHLGQKEFPLRTGDIQFEYVEYDDNTRAVVQLNDNKFDVHYSHPEWESTASLPGTDGGGGGAGGGVGSPITSDQIQINLPDDENGGQGYLTNRYYPFKFQLTGDTSSFQDFVIRTGANGDYKPGRNYFIDGDTQYVFFGYASEYDPNLEYTGNYVEVSVWYYTDEDKTNSDVVTKKVSFTTVENPKHEEGAFWGYSGDFKLTYDGSAKTDYYKPYVIKNTPVEIDCRIPSGNNFDPTVDDVQQITYIQSENRATGQEFDPALEATQQADGKWVFPAAGNYHVTMLFASDKISQPISKSEYIEVHDS